MRPLLTVAAFAAFAIPVAGQDHPRRPRLPEGADTNSARVYYQLGIQHLRSRPRDAAAAFYWVTRLEPASPDGWYGQHVAHLLTNEARLWGYMEGEERVLISLDVRQIDSLALRAVMIDPLFYRGLGHVLSMSYLRRRIARELQTRGVSASETEIQRFIEALSEVYPWDAARLAYGRGDFRASADFWAHALNRIPRAYVWRAERARALVLSSQLDSAAAEMRRGIEASRAADTQMVRYLYESKAAWEYGLARILERRGDLAGARAAYEAALVEDLGYWMVHVRLGLLVLRTADTAAALREMGRAVADAEGEYVAQLVYGEALANAGRHDSAVVHLLAAQRLEPFSAAPYRLLGRAHESAGRAAEARQAYERYLAMARRDDPNLAAIRARLDALNAR